MSLGEGGASEGRATTQGAEEGFLCAGAFAPARNASSRSICRSLNSRRDIRGGAYNVLHWLPSDGGFFHGLLIVAIEPEWCAGRSLRMRLCVLFWQEHLGHDWFLGIHKHAGSTEQAYHARVVEDVGLFVGI